MSRCISHRSLIIRMKYSPHTYAKALVAVLADVRTKRGGGDDEREDARIADNFVALVRRNGDEGNLPRILEEASHLARGIGGVRRVVLESARPFTAAQRKHAGTFLTEGDIVVEKVDPTLIAGIRITVNDELQFDGSLRKKLARLLPF
jgi:F0F1-type ATP synthase delta subunit